jgi:hypothetical protein
MERHMMRKHVAPRPFLPVFPDSHKERQTRFNVQKSNYHDPYADVKESSKALNWLFTSVEDASEQTNPPWLGLLRRMAEISKLAKEIAQNPVLQSSISPYRVDPNKIEIYKQQFKHEDFEVVGYTGFVCQKCLICHPLALYWHTPSMKVVSSIHSCDRERGVEVQKQGEYKTCVIANLSHEMLQLMTQVVKRWTRGAPLIQAVEIPFIPQVMHGTILLESKNWAFRAIQEGLTVLSDDELADFLNLARCNTYAYFRTAKLNKTYHMRLAASAISKDHIDRSFDFGY